jgi:hypothetical protein
MQKGVEVSLHIFLTSAFDGSENSCSVVTLWLVNDVSEQYIRHIISGCQIPNKNEIQKGFCRWCTTLRINGVVDLVHRPEE